jgi:pilus assembly protein Flp/PilA
MSISDTKRQNSLANQSGERGATMVEYAIMVALIAVVVIAAVRVLGTSISEQMSSTAAQVN